MEDNKDLIDNFSKEEDDALFKALDKAQEDLENYLTEENKMISNFIVRGLINGEWKTLMIVLSYSIAEARLKALNVFADPLIVMDLTLWTHSDDVVKRNIEEIALTAYKRKKEKQKEIEMKDNEYETIDILTDLLTYITVGLAALVIISLLIRAIF